MKKFLLTIRPALALFILMTLICGFLYTGVITGIAQVAFPNQANGSIIGNSGSALIAQEFTDPKYLIGRPSGSASNLSPVSDEMKKLIQDRIDWWRAFDPDNTAPVPADLLTVPGSGADPNITPEAAEFQVFRIAKTRGISPEKVRAIITKYTSGRFLGIFGEPAVNVLKVNLYLDGMIN